MQISLGVDTLSYHCRLAEHEITVEAVLDEVAELGAEFVQVNAVHVRDYTESRLSELRGLSSELGLGLTVAGDVIGRESSGDTPQQGADRVCEWAELAQALGSPYVRLSSGFYRNELLGREDQIRREQDFVTAALKLAADLTPGETMILLENHSDFSPAEYVEIIEAVDSARVGVFLDIINPISVLAEPVSVVQLLAPWSVAGHAKDYRLVSHYVADRFHRRGFDVQWCYPGEGVADLPALIAGIRAQPGAGVFRLSIEGLDNYPGVADQAGRLRGSLKLLRELVGASLTGI
jgi:sugar phosphate isomerase/epimerase